MFDVAVPSPSVVRYINVKNNEGVKRIRVNVIYERGLQTNLATLSGQRCWLDDAPPPLDLEGYEDEVPEWGGAEQEVSSGVTEWADCGEQGDEEVEPEPGPSELRWSRTDAPPSESFACSLLRYPANLKRRASVAFRYPAVEEVSNFLGEKKPETRKTELRTTGDWAANGVACVRGDSENYYSNIPHCNPNDQPTETQSGRTAFCRLCGIHVKSTLRRTHIYSHHLRRPMYKCPLCDISSTYHLSNIRVHIRKIHNVTSEPICFKDKFEDEINCLLYRCFGDRQIFRRQDPEVIACLNDILNCVCDGTPLHASKTKTSDGFPAPVPHTSDYLSDGGVPNAAVVEPAFNVHSQPRNTCRLCFETNVKHLERHVLQHHIKKPMYLCPYCNFSSCYSPASVKDHIKTRHSIYEPVPIDMRDEYTELIQSVYDQCFLDDPNTFLNRFLLRQQT